MMLLLFLQVIISKEKFQFDKDLIIYCDDIRLIPIDIAYAGEIFRSISDNTVRFTPFEKPRYFDNALDFIKKFLVQNINS